MLTTHAWIHPIAIAYVPGRLTPALEQTAQALLRRLREAGCTVTNQPTNQTDVIITTAQFGHPVGRDEAVMLNAKRQFKLTRRPMVLTMVEIQERDYQHWWQHFEALARQPSTTHTYPGLGPQAAEVLLTQAQRGGPELALGRLLQAHVVSMRVLALRVEGDRPLFGLHYDLAGAHPLVEVIDVEAFARDAALRLLAAVCAAEVDQHEFVAEPLPRTVWEALRTPDDLIRAGTDFTPDGFFTTPVSVEKLLGYRGLSDAISAQYSEGCYAVFEPEIPGLITTATGSARRVDKRSISRADQAIVVGLKPERNGALVRAIEGEERVLPSVEAVEMWSVCAAVAHHPQRNRRGETVSVPNLRAILHGHVGVEEFNPALVECVTLDAPYYAQLVSCGTGALASGTAAAFARSEALQSLGDPRQVVFLEQPGHGVVMVEKWVAGRRPFEMIRAYLDAGHVRITLTVPQGAVTWQTAKSNGRVVWRKEAENSFELA